MSQSESFNEFLKQWESCHRDPDRTYRRCVDSEPSPIIRTITHPVVLYDVIQRTRGVIITADEKMDLRRLYIKYEESYAVQHSPAVIRLFKALPWIGLLLAAVAVILQNFSWLLIAMAAAAKIIDGYARYLVAIRDQAGPFWIKIFIIVMPVSIALSVFHMFGLVVLP